MIRYEEITDPLGQAQVKLANTVLLFVKGCGWLTSVTLPNVQSIEERRASKVNEIKHLYAFGAKLNNPQLYNNSSSKILSFYFSIRRIYQEEGCQWKITTNQISEGCL